MWIRRALVCAIAAGATLASPTPSPRSAQAADSITRAQLLERFQKVPGLFAKFREEKRIALLVDPLISEGTLHFIPPGRLAKHTLVPAKSSVLVDRGVLRFGDAHARERVDLGRNPVVRLFVNGFVKVLAGDAAALEALYEIEFKASEGERWSMVLRPKKPRMRKIIERVSLAGTGVVLDVLEVHEVGGDVTITTFTDVDPERRYGRAELAQIFRLPHEPER